MIEARFDDLTPGGISFRLVGPVGVVEATRVEEVAATIRAAAAAAERGMWVAGAVTYESAPGLNPSLSVAPRTEGPLGDFPFAWFAMFEDREETLLPEPSTFPPDFHHDAWQPSVDRAAYGRSIAQIHQHIAHGDTYQVNHTLRLRSTIKGDPRGLYRDLCFAQRGAYSAFLDLGRYRILSASPELFFQIEDRRLTTRPMKGTARRGRWADEDEGIQAGLRSSVKDRAENAMIVDLLRNDLGRVAKTGTVTWSDVFEPERYETVWQLTSTVSAELRSDVGLAEVFQALFPSGSVTGAPKVRTMQIISELEDSPRGVYCGAVGFLSPPGAGLPTARFNVAIRTVAIDAETGFAEYGVGGGITWDSRALAEYDEVAAKSRLLTDRRPAFRLLETLGHDPHAGLRRLEDHLARLESSARYFGFAFDRDLIRRALDEQAQRLPDRPSRIRLLLDRQGHVETGGASLASLPEPVRLAVDTQAPVDPGDPFLFHKTTLRSRYEDARARHPDADDVVLTNTRGEITETTIANIAIRLDGRWWSPPLDAGLLPGIERAALVADGSLAERSISLADLQGATDLAVINSVRGWLRAEIDQKTPHVSSEGDRSNE